MNDAITAIHPTKRDPKRASIKVAGRYVAALPYKTIDELGLAVGMVWDDAIAAQVEQASTFDKAYNQALSRLNRRAMSSHQLNTKLRELEHDEDTRQRVIDRLIELGLIDDEAYGRALIREIQNRKAAGPHLLRSKLMQKGLDRNLIDRLIEETEPDHDDAVNQALELARRKLRSLRQVDTNTQKRRVWGLLARRGFNSDVIATAVQQAIADDDD